MTKAIVIGGGLVGLSVAFGLLRNGVEVEVLDGGDRDIRASKANFGLIALQSKGMGMAAYANLSRESSDLWPEFAASLEGLTGIPLSYAVRGGYAVALSEEELERRRAFVARLNAQPGILPVPTEFLDRADLLARNPHLGPEVAGASFCPLDGTVDVLAMFHALHQAVFLLGGVYRANRRVEWIGSLAGRPQVATATGRFEADIVVLAAGLDNQRLAGFAGIDPGLHGDPGTILVTERTESFLPDTMGSIRQTQQGSVLIGGSPKSAAIDTRIRLDEVARMAARAMRYFPRLERLRVVRSWRGLRILTRDGFPLYQQAEAMPGVFLCACHSGVTLAAFHALRLAPMIAAGGIAPRLDPFHTRRYHVPEAA